MKTAKRLLTALLLLACCLSLSGCMLMAARILGGTDDSVSKEEICEYVVEHIEEISAFPYADYKNTSDDETGLSFIKEALGEDTIVKSVYRYSPKVLQFYCGGTGNVTSSVYCGFYYSDTDAPFAFEFQDEAQFTQISEGVYEWESEDGERAFYTERILPKWFWYHQRWN